MQAVKNGMGKTCYLFTITHYSFIRSLNHFFITKNVSGLPTVSAYTYIAISMPF